MGAFAKKSMCDRYTSIGESAMKTKTFSIFIVKDWQMEVKMRKIKKFA